MKKTIILCSLFLAINVHANEELERITNEVCGILDPSCRNLIKNGELSLIAERMSIGQYHMIENSYNDMVKGTYHYPGISREDSLEIITKLKKINDEKLVVQRKEEEEKNKKRLEEVYNGAGKEIYTFLKNSEEEFEKIDVAALAAKFDYAKLNELKDKYLNYIAQAETLENIKDRKGLSSIKSYLLYADSHIGNVFLSPVGEKAEGTDKEKFLKSIEVFPDEQYSSVVSRKFVEYLKLSAPIIKKFEVEQAELKLKKEKEEEQARKENEERLEKLYSSPDCYKVRSFYFYCNSVASLATIKEKINYEKRISNKAGFVDRNYFNSLMRAMVIQEEKVAEDLKQLNKIKSKVIDSSKCKVSFDKDQGASNVGEATKTLTKEKLQQYCEIDSDQL